MRQKKYDWSKSLTSHESRKLSEIDAQLESAKQTVSSLYAARGMITNKAAARARYQALKAARS